MRLLNALISPRYNYFLIPLVNLKSRANYIGIFFKTDGIDSIPAIIIS